MDTRTSAERKEINDEIKTCNNNKNKEKENGIEDREFIKSEL